MAFLKWFFDNEPESDSLEQMPLFLKNEAWFKRIELEHGVTKIVLTEDAPIEARRSFYLFYAGHYRDKNDRLFHIYKDDSGKCFVLSTKGDILREATQRDFENIYAIEL